MQYDYMLFEMSFFLLFDYFAFDADIFFSPIFLLLMLMHAFADFRRLRHFATGLIRLSMPYDYATEQDASFICARWRAMRLRRHALCLLLFIVDTGRAARAACFLCRRSAPLTPRRCLPLLRHDADMPRHDDASAATPIAAAAAPLFSRRR